MVITMKNDMKVLLIGGGGTLGTYTAEELLKIGYEVDVVCPEEKYSDNKNLHFYRKYATLEFLAELFSQKSYDGVINFIHYTEVEEYKPFHELISKNTKHLVFLSSYRIYADLQHPITEEAPLLLDTVKDDEQFINTEKYALSKARCERYIRNESTFKNWTIVRPVISFSDKRFDLVTATLHQVIDAAKTGETLIFPEKAKGLTSSLDWAGNTGKLIANLLFKQDSFCEAYTVSSAQNLTWSEIADIYIKLTGVKIQWVDTEEYIKAWHSGYGLVYDRLYDRAIDNSKILKATGLKKEDFVSIEDGLKIELSKIR